MLSLWRACRPLGPLTLLHPFKSSLYSSSFVPLVSSTSTYSLHGPLGVRHASSKPSYRSEKLAGTQQFQSKRPKRKEGDSSGPRSRPIGQRNRAAYFRNRGKDERPHTFRRPPGTSKATGKSDLEGEEKEKKRYPSWNKPTKDKPKLQRKLAGKKDYPTKEKGDEEPVHVAPKQAKPKVVRRGDVSGSVTLPPKKEVNSNASEKSFQQLGVNSSMREALQTMNISNPTLIQEMAIPAILKSRQDFVFAAQTGTGKTLAYLAPIAQRLKMEEENFKKHQEQSAEEAEEIEDGEEGEGKKGGKGAQALRSPTTFRRREGRPRAIVLVPNRELAEQVGKVAKAISHVVKLKTETVSGGKGTKVQYKMKLKSFLDILVATPGRLLKHLEDDRISLRDVGYVVLDEGDSLLAKGQGFDDDMTKLFKVVNRRMVKPLPEGEIPIQFIVVTATLTPTLLKSIQTRLPAIKTLVTPSIHKNLENLRQRFLHVVGGDKHETLLKLVKDSTAKHTIVFCNTADSARSTEYKLKEWGLDATILHGEVPPKVREQNWKHFRETPGSYLVCTDIASRGLDTTMVDLIINFDFPFNTIDYLHRVGRTARAGNSGSVVSLLAKKDEALGTGIIHAVNKGLSLENISADRRDNQSFFQKLRADQKQEKLVKKGKITKMAPTKPKYERPKRQRGSRRLLQVVPRRDKKKNFIRPKRKSRKRRDTGEPAQ